MDTSENVSAAAPADIHTRIGLLTRQLHDSLNELGIAQQLHHSMSELPDAQSRLSYIARLTGDAANKVLAQVDMAKDEQAEIAKQTNNMRNALVADPVAAVAKGHIMNYLEAMEKATQAADSHLTEIMMAQDFHDLTGQVIARVVTLTSSIEEQLVQLLIQTAPPHAVPQQVPTPPVAQPLAGPVVDPSNTPNVVTNQSEVDDLLASLGF